MRNCIWNPMTCSHNFGKKQLLSYSYCDMYRIVPGSCTFHGTPDNKFIYIYIYWSNFLKEERKYGIHENHMRLRRRDDPQSAQAYNRKATLKTAPETRETVCAEYSSSTTSGGSCCWRRVLLLQNAKQVFRQFFCQLQLHGGSMHLPTFLKEYIFALISLIKAAVAGSMTSRMAVSINDTSATRLVKKHFIYSWHCG